GSVDLTFYVDGDADVRDFRIERSISRYGIYSVIGRVEMPNSAPYIVEFSDYSADPSHMGYYYRVSATQSCGSGVDTVSNVGRNILLRVSPNANLSNTLRWNPY